MSTPTPPARAQPPSDRPLDHQRVSVHQHCLALNGLASVTLADQAFRCHRSCLSSAGDYCFAGLVYHVPDSLEGAWRKEQPSKAGYVFVPTPAVQRASNARLMRRALVAAGEAAAGGDMQLQGSVRLVLLDTKALAAQQQQPAVSVKLLEDAAKMPPLGFNRPGTELLPAVQLLNFVSCRQSGAWAYELRAAPAPEQVQQCLSIAASKLAAAAQQQHAAGPVVGLLCRPAGGGMPAFVPLASCLCARYDWGPALAAAAQLAGSAPLGISAVHLASSGSSSSTGLPAVQVFSSFASAAALLAGLLP